MAQNLMSVAGVLARAAAAAFSSALGATATGAAGAAAAEVADEDTALSVRLCTVDFSTCVALVVRR